MLLRLLVWGIHHVIALAFNLQVDDSIHDIAKQHTLDYTLTELHVVMITLQENVSSTNRREEEKHRLLQRLVRRKGCTDKNHPRARLLTTLHGFSRYKDRNKADLQRWRENYGHMPKHHRKTLDRVVQYSKKLLTTEQLIHKNHELCQKIVETALDFYGISRQELDRFIMRAEAEGKIADRVSVNQALKHFVRDWSMEGALERKTFPCILSTLDTYSIGRNRSMTTPLKILVPGAGLGRLGYGIDRAGGFEVTLNEWSMYMNLAYRFVDSLPAGQYHSFHPFIESWSHHATTEDMQRAATFPDVSISKSSLVMVEGDFSTAFATQKNHYDFVVTHFFIDTARNLMDYLETIHDVLKSGAYWINTGPLLYGTGPWVQLSLHEIIAVIEDMGFVLEDLADTCGDHTFADEKVRWMPSIYGSNERALNMNGYRVQSWVARKL